MALCGPGSARLYGSQGWDARRGAGGVRETVARHRGAGQSAPARGRHLGISESQPAERRHWRAAATSARYRCSAKPGDKAEMKSRIACSLVLILALSVLTGCCSFRAIGDFFNLSTKKTKMQGQ